MICLFVHRRYIGDNKIGRSGLVGLIGLPMKLIQTYQAFVGIAIKATGAILMKGVTLESLYLFGLFSVIHLGITGLTIAIVTPVAFSKQGAEYWSSLFSGVPAISRFCPLLWDLKRVAANLTG